MSALAARRADHAALDEVRYPAVTARLLAHDGDAFVVLGRVSAAMAHAGIARREIDAFLAQATGNGVTHMLRTVLDWVLVS